MKKALFLIIALATASSAFAEQFKVSYTDKNSLVWSQPLSGNYSNGCLDSQGNPDLGVCSTTISGSQDSSAEAACERIGGRLPTTNEFENLITELGGSNQFIGEFGVYSVVLTKSGYVAFLKTFTGSMNGELFWTSSVRSEAKYAEVFQLQADTLNDKNYGNTLLMDRRYHLEGVICVK